jgi:hypothetical protein
MGLRNIFEDVLSVIKDKTSIDYVRVWNDQVSLMDRGEIYSYPNLACFVEIVLAKNGLGLGIVGGDINIRFHIVHTELDAQDGTMEQNLTVFQWRDELISSLTYLENSSLSGFQLVGEQPDYNHSNVYHYVVELIAHYIDTTGDVTKDWIVKDPPTDLLVTGTLETI